MNEKKAVNGMSEQNTPNPQDQQLLMPWLVLSDQIKMTNQRIDDLRSDMIQRFEQVDAKFNVIDGRFDKIDEKFDKIDAKFDKIDAKLDKRVDRLTTITMTLAGILVTFFVTYLTLR